MRDFGTLGTKVRGIITFAVSPYEQKAFAGVIKQGLPNMFRRFTGQVFRVTPPFILAYLIWDWGETDYYRRGRKNPKDFENDQ